MRAKSAKPAKGAGWIHDLNGAPIQLPREPKPQRRREDIDWGAEVMKRFEHPRALMQRLKTATQLGVSAKALEGLCVGYGCDRDGREYASFPMKARGKFVGYVRRYQDGGKKTAWGSKCGLFYAEEWNTGGAILMPEGASDVARLIDLGISAVGRPACLGGVDLLDLLLRGNRRQPLLVLGEWDFHPERRGKLESCPAECAGCMHCWPGKAGAIETARQLGEALRRPVRAMFPPDGAKDARDWVGSCGREFVKRLIPIVQQRSRR